MLNSNDVIKIAKLIKDIHYTTSTYYNETNLIRWSFKPTHSVRGSTYILTLELDSNKAWFVDSVFNDFSGVYTKSIDTIQDVTDMLHSITTSLEQWS